MDCKEIREMYKLMFAEYPDIVTVKDLQTMLGISRHAAYDLLGEGEISCIRLANAYKIPKINVINYVLKSPCGQTRVKTAYPTSKVHSPHCRQLTSTAAQTEYAP